MSPVPQPSNKTLTSLGSNPIIRRKRKLVSSGGQKWFKGSPKKCRAAVQPPPQHVPIILSSSNNNNNLGLDTPPPLLPPMLVQLSFEGSPDIRISVYDQIGVSSKENEDHHHGDKRINKNIKEENYEEGGRPLPQPLFRQVDKYELKDASPLPNAYIRWMDGEELGEEVEYHVDEEDSAWLDLINAGREGGAAGVTLEVMELLMDRLEKESYLQMQSSGLDQRPVIDDDAVCCICMDGECQNSNAILFCDMCNLAVHQECYGVPYIPEGQWLCRRCLQSPSREVECVLCPNKGGAFKQTDDGRWAHVVCAIWIPEVCFANTVFLEPVDSVNNIPPARWRLCCFICKYKGRGACIQCHKSNCYVAFHVTCAQHAGLCMRMDTVRVGSTVTVRKTAYCDNHAPPDFIRSRDGDSPSVRQKLKACRKMLAEKRSAKPTVSIPTIPPDRLTEIASSVSFIRKSQFIKRLLSYWKLKRIQRNGVPLLRRLQAATNHPPSASHNNAPLVHSLSSAPSQNDHAWRFLTRLRQDLEKARLLCELIRKREKQKRELVAIKTEAWAFTATPFTQFLYSVLDELGARDTQGFFSDPVDAEAVPDYHTVISSPMDLATMRARATSLFYNSLFPMKLDFDLMIDNCLLYNSKDSVFHRAALRLQEAGRIIFKEAERMSAQIGFDSESWLHLDTAPILKQTSQASRQTDDQICEEMENFLKDERRHNLPGPVHITKLQEMIDKVINLEHPLAKKNRYKKLYREMQRVRRLETPRSPKSPKPVKKESSSSHSKRQVNPSPSPAPIISPRKLRRKSVVEEQDGEEVEKGRERPPKRRVVQQMQASKSPTQQQQQQQPSRRSSRSLENSPTQNTPQKCAVTPQRRNTRLSVDSERLRTPKTPLTNGLVRNGKSKNTPTSQGGGRRALAPHHPPPDAFSVYRDTERNSSDGEEQEDDEENNEEEEEEASENSSTEEEESESESYSDSDSAAVTHRVTRGGGGEMTLRKRRKDSSSSDSSSEEEEGEGEEKFTPERVVWAFSDGAWSPAIIVDPDALPPDKNGVSVPAPPESVIARRPLLGRRRKESFLVLLFDNKSTWQWVTREELELLGVTPTIDKRKLDDSRKRKWVRRGYEKAILISTLPAHPLLDSD